MRTFIIILLLFIVLGRTDFSAGLANTTDILGVAVPNLLVIIAMLSLLFFFVLGLAWTYLVIDRKEKKAAVQALAEARPEDPAPRQ